VQTKTCYLQVTCEFWCASNTKAHKIALYDTFAVFYAEYDNFFSILYIEVIRKYSLTFQVKLSTAYPQVLRFMTKLYTFYAQTYPQHNNEYFRLLK